MRQRAFPHALALALALSLPAFALLVAQAQTRERRALARVAVETVARGERLTVGDIAEVRAPDSATAERIRSVALGYAPNVGAVRELSRDQIALALAAAGFPASAVGLESPAVVLITRAAQTVDPALVRAAVERAALTDLSAHGAVARLVRLDLPPAIDVPSGALEVRASLRGVRNLFAPFMVNIELLVDGRVARRLSATSQVEAFAPVLVAARDMAVNSRLREQDVRAEPRRLGLPPSSYLREATQLRGVSLRRAVARGDALTLDLIVAEIIIRPGDPVRIVGESGDIRISVNGEARAAGRVGDRIQVKNLQSGALLQAIIVDEGLVRVRF